jgi:predicted RNase H-like HicB family nuclease
MNVTAVCERSGDWWAVSVPEVEGAFTQAKRLDQVPEMVADAVELLTGTPAVAVSVTVEARVPGTSAAEELKAAAQLEEQVRELLLAATTHRQLALKHYKEAGLSTRDIGVLAGISYQRVSQILADAAIAAKGAELVAAGPDAGVDFVLRQGGKVWAVELKRGPGKTWEFLRALAERVSEGEPTEEVAIARARELLRESGGGELAVFSSEGARTDQVTA